MVDLAMLVLRVALGLVFLAHGIKHARGRVNTTNWFAKVGFKRAPFNWFMSTVTEIAVGILLVLGLLTSLGVAALVGVMVVAYWTVHRKQGFWVTARPEEGWEYVFTLAIAGVAVGIAGPGEFSIDQALGFADNLDGLVGLALAAAGALMAAGQIAVFWRPDQPEDGESAAG